MTHVFYLGQPVKKTHTYAYCLADFKDYSTFFYFEGNPRTNEQSGLYDS